MNLHQFRFVQEAARRNLNLTEAAKALHTSQPGVSKATEGLAPLVVAEIWRVIESICSSGISTLIVDRDQFLHPARA